MFCLFGLIAKVQTMSRNSENQKFRRLALSSWIESKGGMKQLAEDRKLSNSLRSQMYHVMRGYSFGTIAARNIEKKLGMTPGWLDSMEDEIEADKTLGEIFDTVTKERCLALLQVAWLLVGIQKTFRTSRSINLFSNIEIG